MTKRSTRDENVGPKHVVHNRQSDEVKNNRKDEEREGTDF